MNLTSRKRRPLNRNIPHLRDTHLIIIATEGEKTEKQYFKSSMFQSSRVQVKVLPTKDGRSAPTHVLKRLREFARTTQLNSDDQLWLVLDKDRWPDAQLAEVTKLVSQMRRISTHSAISSPCFELWLYLHRDKWKNGPISSEDMSDALRRKLGSYNRSNLDMDFFIRRLDDAIKRAKDLETYPNNRWPDNPGTHVYKLVEEILALV